LGEAGLCYTLLKFFLEAFGNFLDLFLMFLPEREDDVDVDNSGSL
jgi:hypothetical protein